MHATIAGLSSGVATAAIAYSVKTAGVLETCSVGDAVVDPRELGTAEVVERLWAVWEARVRHREVLARERSGMERRTAEQMTRIVAACGLGAPDPAMR
jgi:polysaccharide pyruvyl transferase WcaK-like protein